MTDGDIEDKLAELAAYRSFTRDVHAIADAVWSLDETENAAEVMSLVDMPAQDR